MRFAVLACVAGLTMFASVADAQVFNAPAIGGGGGGPFDDACHGDDVLVGYNVTSGKAVNRFAAVCQAQRNGVLIGSNYGLHTYGEDNRDGPYKTFATPRCPPGMGISRLEVYINNFGQLDSVAASCAPLLRNARGGFGVPRSSTDGGVAKYVNYSDCPKGMIAVGVVGRYGALVDALGLKCAPFPWH